MQGSEAAAAGRTGAATALPSRRFWPVAVVPQHPSPFVRYGFAVAAAGLGIGAASILRPVLGPQFYLFLFPAVVLSAWYAGFRPGIVTSLLAVAAADLLFYAPIGTFELAVGSDVLELGIFLTTVLLVSSTTEALRRAHDAAESRVRASRRLAAIVRDSDDAIIGKDLNGVITSWNRGAERMYGYAADEATGEPISMLVPPEIENDVPAIIERLRRGERIERYETVRMTRDGRRLDVSLTISPIRDREGRIVGASKIARDVTERKEADAERERLLRAAERADRLVDDLLDVARIEAGGFMVEPEPVEPAVLLSDAAEAMAGEARTAGLELRVEDAEGLPAVLGDHERCARVFANLLSNAVKYTPEGGRVTLRAVAAGDAVRFDVSDTGPRHPGRGASASLRAILAGPAIAAGRGRARARDREGDRRGARRRVRRRERAR